ncbi:MAG: hypothetical protein SWH78_16570 [Thermodesulfobacteriota bacterium]|nr:hypothetical protein [Thermodesulfobacteriota bacterium]
MKGTIKKGDSILFKDIEIWLGIPEKKTFSSLVGGFFEFPQSQFIDVGGPYQLILEDGRSGEIDVMALNGDVQIGFTALFTSARGFS